MLAIIKFLLIFTKFLKFNFKILKEEMRINFSFNTN